VLALGAGDEGQLHEELLVRLPLVVVHDRHSDLGPMLTFLIKKLEKTIGDFGGPASYICNFGFQEKCLFLSRPSEIC
jgi:hypothetical protein